MLRVVLGSRVVAERMHDLIDLLLAKDTLFESVWVNLKVIPFPFPEDMCLNSLVEFDRTFDLFLLFLCFFVFSLCVSLCLQS